MKVRLLMTCEQAEIDKACTFRCNYGDDPETKEFFKYTPFGYLQFNTVNDTAVKSFEVGKQYYLTLEPK